MTIQDDTPYFVTHLSNVSVIGGNVLKIVWFITPQFGYPHCVGVMYMSMCGLSLVPIVWSE